MSDTLTQPVQSSAVSMTGEAPIQAMSASDRLFIQHHDTVLRDLLGTDYEFAHDSGLTDMFYLNPETGEDALTHILTGDVLTGDDGALLPGGYHHEPSSRDGSTFVDREHLARRNSRESRDFREVPYNPYAAHIVVEGFRKTANTRNAETNELTARPINNGMFPKEYDALTVMQTIRQAVESRDPSKDRRNDTLLVNESEVTLLDGQTTMRVKFWLDIETGKVVTAFPTNMSKSRMKLSKDEIHQHLGLK